MASRKNAAQQIAQAVFGSASKHKSNADAQIQREVQRLEKQLQQQTAAQGRIVHNAVRQLKPPKSAQVKVSKSGTVKTPNGVAGGSNVPAYRHFP